MENGRGNEPRGLLNRRRNLRRSGNFVDSPLFILSWTMRGALITGGVIFAHDLLEHYTLQQSLQDSSIIVGATLGGILGTVFALEERARR